MPFVDIRIAGSATRAQKAAIVADVTKALLWRSKLSMILRFMLSIAAASGSSHLRRAPASTSRIS